MDAALDLNGEQTQSCDQFGLEASLALFRLNPVEFLRRYLTVDETWISYYTPETKEQSKRWVFKGDPAPKKAKTVKSAGKVMPTVFWDARGIIYVDYWPKDKR
ncbi:hypothetical protein AVEN_152138-1 [Araneus ventricosus]|uniref:Transposase n=1 Tax=Araneus ventricosus TaxID=182803 RepID=A0A4Y2MUQ9_ARAVE|nr:hypothetical protein AVEN_152138-1 [Araneus ventricosus]